MSSIRTSTGDKWASQLSLYKKVTVTMDARLRFRQGHGRELVQMGNNSSIASLVYARPGQSLKRNYGHWSGVSDWLFQTKPPCAFFPFRIHPHNINLHPRCALPKYRSKSPSLSGILASLKSASVNAALALGVKLSQATNG